MLAALTPEDIERARAEVSGLPRSTWLADDEDCRALTDAIARAHLRLEEGTGEIAVPAHNLAR